MDSKQGIHVMTLANSIIGVSILAMPYCFKQCGIFLSIVLLIFSSILSRLACHFLLKSAIKARLRTFEFLAYHVFGSLGKLTVEIGMIGFLVGTCIAFFVVMGDLGPHIISTFTERESTSTLRTGFLVVIAIFCVLPLGLLRKVDSLSVVCTATIGFYVCLVIKIMAESAPHLLMGDWFDKVDYWRPAGILQCLPIFSMALFCQTQLFEIYQAIPNASLEKMNGLVRVAVNICTAVYIFVGVFGYIALSHEPNFSGNILLSFKASLITELMKIGFVLSVAFSFPLVIFPCRASMYSLLSKPTYSGLHESSTIYIPEGKFKLLTFLIVLVSMIIGIMIPNIELVLGLIGSTIGIMICVLFPATCFICLTSKNTNERILAQIMLFIGIVVMVLGTYANLYAMEQVVVATEKSELKHEVPEEKILITTLKAIMVQKAVNGMKIGLEAPAKEDLDVEEIRKEPPQPEPPEEGRQEQLQLIIPKESDDAQPKHENLNEFIAKEVRQEPPQPLPPREETPKEVIKKEQPLKVEPKVESALAEEPKLQETKDSSKKQVKEDQQQEAPQATTSKILEVKLTNLTDQVQNKPEEVDIEAIRKEDKEISDDKDNAKVETEVQKLKEENKKLHEVLKEKEKQEILEKETKIKAVKEIQHIAKEAIARIVDSKTDAEISKLGEVNKVEAGNKDVKHDSEKVKNNDEVKHDNEVKNNEEVLPLETKNQMMKNLIPLPLVLANTTKFFNKSDIKPDLNILNILRGNVTKENQEKIVENPQNIGTNQQNANQQGIKEIHQNISGSQLKSAKVAEETQNVPSIIKQSDTKTADVKKDAEINEKLDSIRRDILSDNDYLRMKRDVETEQCENNETKLDEVKLDVGKLDAMTLTRDLKSVKVTD